jgi:hypothetical protein
MIAADPFSKEWLIDSPSVEEWDPFFGTFSTESSGAFPPELSLSLLNSGLTETERVLPCCMS